MSQTIKIDYSALTNEVSDETAKLFRARIFFQRF